MKLIKLLLLFLAGAFSFSGASGQTANASLNILTLNSGQVSLGGVVDVQVTVGNTGPGSILANKVRAQISIPIAIASAQANGLQTGLPPGWTITANTGGAITICNGSDVIPAGVQRQIFIKLIGTALGGPSTINGNLLFSSGTSCTTPGTLPGDVTADNTGTTTIQVIPAGACNLALTASAGTIACNGGTTTLTATPTGAAGAVEYSLNGGAFQAGNTFTVNAAGSPYTVTAREVNTPACTATATPVTVTEPSAVVAASTAGTIACFGGTTTVTVTATGGTAPYTGTGSFTVSAGAYSYTVTDANGCTSVTSGTVNQPSAVVAASAAGTILCNGGTATVTVTATGGTAPYTGTGTFVVSAGTYSYTVTDANGCTSVTSITVAESTATAVVATSSATPILCNGASSTVTVSATGGTAPYTGTGTFSQAAGTQSYTVTDANGCTGVTTITITQPSAIFASSSAPPIALPGGSTTVTVNATGGTPPYTGTGTFVRTAGTYTFTITDANGCTAATTITLTNPVAGNANASLNILTLNSGVVTQGGIVDVQVTVGNTGPSFIGVNKVRAQISIPIAIAGAVANALQTGLPAGWTITANTGGSITICNGTDIIPAGTQRQILIKVQGNAVGGPSTINGNLIFSNGSSCTIPGSLPGDNTADNTGTTTIQVVSGCNLGVTASAGTIACNGGTTTLTATPTGAAGAVEYSLNGGAFQAGNTFTVSAGTYVVTAREVNTPACTATATSVTVTEPSAVVAASTAGTIACFGGTTTVTVTATGGTAPYTGTGSFTVSAGAYSYTVTDANGCTSVTSGTVNQPSVLVAASAAGTILCNGGTATVTVTATGGTAPYTGTGTFTVSAGAYSYTVTDANGCTSITSGTVTQPTAVTASATSTPVTTIGGTDGTATVTAGGGTAPYTYAWTPGGQTTATATGLSAGNYSVTVTDANGCTATATTTVGSPACNVTLSFTQTNVLCFGASTGTATVTAANATGTVTYSWSNGQTTATATGLSAGTYNVTVTDGAGCIASGSVTITQPASALVAASTAGTIACFGGTTTVTVTATGGTAPYTGTGTFTVSAGAYSYTVTDANGCTSITSGTVTQPSAITATAVATNVTCNGASTGSVNLTVSGGTPFGGAGLTVTQDFNTLASSGTSSALPAGWAIAETGTAANTIYTAGTGSGNTGDTYSFGTAAADRALGGLQSGSLIPVIGAFFTNTTGSTVTSLDISYTGEQWRLGATARVDRLDFQFSTNATSLTTGTYTDVNALDFTAPVTAGTTGALDGNLAANRTVITSTITGLSIAPGATVWIRWNDLNATGSDDGLAIDDFSITMNGGAAAPYQFLWSNGATTEDLSGLAAGIYSVTITDANGCTATASATITQPTAVTASATSTPVTTIGGTDGTATVTAAGGTAPYTYAWTPGGQTTATAAGLAAGNYSVTVTDANGCTATATTTVGSPACNVTLSFTQTNVLCFGASTGTATVTAANATGTVTYLWGNGQTTATATGLSAGTYNVTVTDGAGCIASGSVTITQPASALVAASTAGTIACAGGTTTVTVTATGGTAPYTGTGTFTVSAGAYSYTVTDANGCTAVTTGSVTAIPDVTNPTITAPVNVSACTNTGCTATGVMLGTPVTADNCNVASVTNNAPAAFPLGTTTIIWTVTDGSGNTATATQTVNVTDCTAPAIYVNQSGLLPGVTGPNSSASPYLLPLKNGVKFTSLLTVPDLVGGYQMVGIPDGLGAFNNNDGTFTLLMSHELGNTVGVARAHGGIGAFVSKWVINKSTLQVQSGSDLMQQVYNWNTATQSINPTPFTFSFGRFCSADLPEVSAYYNAATGLGSQARIYMHGEEGTSTGYQVATVANGSDAGKAYILGKFNFSTNGSGITAVGAWENTLANPFAQDKTFVIGLNDGGTGIMSNSLSVYVGTKTNTGTEVDKAGLTNGTLKSVLVSGNPVEIVNATTRATNITSGTAFTLSSTASTTFSRPEDGLWNPADPKQFFFVTTDRYDQVKDGIGAQIGRSRLWRLNFTDVTNPDLGGTIDLLLDGTEAGNMFDNMGADKQGNLLLQEDVGGQAHSGKIWQYNIATDQLELLAKHDPARFGDVAGGVSTPATAPFNNDEEASGIIDMSDILGEGMHILVDQTHYNAGLPASAVEGGQLLVMFNPASLGATSTAQDTVRVCSGTGVNLGTPATADNCSVASVTNNAPSTFPVGTTLVTWTVTDGSGNTATATQVVIVSDLAAASTATTVSCNGGSSTVTVTATGGTAPYTGTGTFSRTAGTYTFTVTDARGCTATTTITVTEPTAITVSATSTPVTSTGGTDGTATVTAAGGTAPYTYAWTPGGQTTATAAGLAAGNYSVTVTDANGCTATATTTVGSPACNVTLSFTQTNVLCFGASTGTATVTAANATGTVTYSWSNGQTTATATGLSAGTYNVTVTDGAGCIASGSVTITQPASALVAASTAGTIACFGGTTTVTVTATGGTAPYTGTGTFTVSAGAYSYTVTDANGCTSVTTGTVALSTATAVVATSSATVIACTGGSATVTVSATGGTAPYTGTGTFVRTAGTYSFTVTDANGCTGVTSITITQPALLFASSGAPAIALPGGSTTVTVTASGGTAPYTGTGTFVRTAGTYSFSVTDARGCTANTTITLSDPVPGPTNASLNILTLNAGQVNLGGFVDVQVTVGNTGTSFIGVNKVRAQISIPVAIASAVANALQTGLPAGWIITTNTGGVITICNGTDIIPAGVQRQIFIMLQGTAVGGPSTINGNLLFSNGTSCTTPGTLPGDNTADNTSTSTIQVISTCNLALTASAGTIACNGGTTTLTATATGATGAIEYSLNGGTFQAGNTFTVPAGSYTVSAREVNTPACTATATVVTVTEPAVLVAAESHTAILCFGGSSVITISATGGTAPYTGTGDFTVNAGTYSYTVTDANGCSSSVSVTVTQPAVITASATSTPVTTTGGTDGAATVAAAGGTAPYTYAWTPGGQTSATATGLAAGNYSVTVTDANGCTATATTTVGTPTCSILASASAGTIACFGGTTTLTVTVTGATGAVQYSLNGGAFQASNMFTVVAGSYTVTVKDASNCTGTAAAVMVSQPVALVAASSATAIACNGGSSTVTVTATGGTAPYTGTGTFTVVAGTYTYTVTDANGCTAVTTVTVSQPAVLVAASSATAIACNGGSSTVTVTATGGTAPYTGTGTFTVVAGTYSYTVTDAKGCTAVTTVTVSQPAVLVAASSATAIACNGGSSTVTVTATGGTAPYTGTGTFTRTAGTYTFTVTDAKGCTAVTTITIAQPAVLVAASTATAIACNGGSSTVTVTATGGTAPYTGTGTFTRTAGTYTFTVTDANGCTAVTTITIAQPAVLTATATSTAATSGSNGTATANPTGGTAPYTYLWAPGGQTTATATGLAAGTYTVTVTDSRGCTASATVTVASNGCNLIVNAGPDKALCNGASTTLTASVTGASAGTPPATPFLEVSGSTSDMRIFSGNIDHITIGNTFSQSEDRNNCNRNTTSSKTLTIPAGAIVKKAYMYWSGSGLLDDKVKLNGASVTADGTKTYSRSGGFKYFAARKDITNLITASGTYTVSDLTWSNGSPYCYDNSAYGGWAMTVIYEKATLPSARIHVNTEKFQFTYPAGTYSTTINNISVPAGCSANATLTFVAFEGDNYKGEKLRIAGVLDTDPNNFRGQSGPNLDIITKNAPSIVAGTTSLTYSIESDLQNTVFGPATEGLFDYVKVLKYNYCPPAVCNIGYVWKKNGATVGTTQSISVSTAGTYVVTATDCAGCIATDEVVVTASTLTASATPGTISCYGGSTSVTVSATGGTAPYTGTGTFSKTAGTYSFTVTDAAGCTKVTSVTITQPTQLVMNATAPAIPCGSTTTTVTVSATGGTAPYSGTATFVRAAGTYTFTVSDAKGCTVTKTITIAAPVCGPVDPTKCYKLVARHSGKAATVAGSSVSNGGNVEQKTYNGNANQIWKFAQVETGYYQVINQNSSKVLDVAGASTSNGANVHQWAYTGGNNQKWSLTSSGSYFVMKAKHSGKAMSVAGSSTSNGANVEQRGTGSNHNEQWTIAEVGCPILTKTSDELIVKSGGSLEQELTITVMPNPGITYFNLTIKSSDNTTPVDVKVLDANGKVMSIHQKAGVNSTLRINAEKWTGGMYFAEVTQGNERKVVKMIKVN